MRSVSRLSFFQPARRLFLQAFLIKVKLVQHPVNNRRERNAYYADEHQPAKKRVRRSKDFRARIAQLIDWPHSAENHRRLQQGIDPAKTRDPMITRYADEQGNGDQETSYRNRRCQSLNKDGYWRQFFVLSLKWLDSHEQAFRRSV
jgi:hypothetical protein